MKQAPGGEMRLLWQFSTAYNQLPEPFHSPWVRVGRYFLILSGALIPAFILIKRRLRQTLYFKVYVFITIPLIWIGFHNNELLFKASLNMFFILTILIFSQWKVSGKARRVAIMIFLCLTCMHIYTDTNRRHLYKYSWNPEVTKKNIRNEWGGHLNHPEDHWYKHFWGRQGVANSIPAYSNNVCLHGSHRYPLSPIRMQLDNSSFISFR